MPSLAIKNVPPALHRQLKKLAAAENRSLNAEVIHRLRASLPELLAGYGAELEAMRAARSRIRLRIRDDEELNRMKRAGRRRSWWTRT